MQTIPKGSFHKATENKSKLYNTTRVRSIRKKSFQKSTLIQEFKDFEVYLQYMKNKEQMQIKENNTTKKNPFKSSRNSKELVKYNPSLQTQRHKPFLGNFRAHQINNIGNRSRSLTQTKLNPINFKLNHTFVQQNRVNSIRQQIQADFFS